MAWNPEFPNYEDMPSRDAYRAGYSDGYHGHKRDHGDWPVQPYSRGYWEGREDAQTEHH